MSPEQAEETRAWLDKALLDLRAAEILLAGKPKLIEPALFHCQQAAEKAMKAYLVWHGRPFTKTHDLVALLSLCTQVEPGLATLENSAIALTPYAVAYRYPGETPVPTPKHAVEALRLARLVFSCILDRLPPEVRS